MKGFFSNKLNIVLCAILALLVGVGIFFAVNILKKEPVKAIDFTNMTESQIVEWAKDNGVSDKLEIKHEYSDTIKDDYPIYVSVKVGNEIEETLLVIISDGIDYTQYIEIVFNKATKKEDLEAFFQEKNLTNIEYVYEEKEGYDSGRIVTVSPDLVKGDEKITVTLAKGKLVEVPDFNYYTKTEVNDWAKANSIKINYEYQNSSQAKDLILDQSIKAGEYIEQNTTVDITLSTGVSTKKDVTGTICTNSCWLGKSETEFVEAVKTLGFGVTKSNDRYYSLKSAKDTIYSYDHDDGNTYTTGTKVNYALSNGQYTFDKTKFEDKALKTVLNYVDDLNDHNAHIVFDYEKTNTTEHDNGVVYDCKSEFDSPNTSISCKLANNTSSEKKNEESTSDDKTGKICTDACWLGKGESAFIEGVQSIGFDVNKEEDRYYSLNSAKDTIYSYDHDDGNTYPKGTKVNYALSLGKYVDNFNADDYKGKTLAQAESIINKYNDLNARISTSISTTTVKTNDYTVGTLFNCSAAQNGNTVKISCSLAQKADETSVTKYKVKDVQNNVCGSDTSCTLDNIQYTISYATSDTVASGAVISQSIPAGTEVDAGTSVNVVLSKGKEPTTTYTVPTLTSNPCGSATSCTVDNIQYIVTSQYSNTIASGAVISQSIAAGEKVDSGTKVNVVISKGEEQKKILDFNDYQTTSLNYHSVDDTKNWIAGILGSFDISYVEASSKDYSIGTLISISVNGNTNYTAGNYPLSTKVVVTICNKQG